MSIKAISPDESLRQKSDEFPREVIEAVNELIRQRWQGKGSFCIGQKEIVDLALKNFASSGYDTTSQELFDKHWLDFEPLFEKEGWKVIYDKPGYNETYEAFFTFSKRN